MHFSLLPRWRGAAPVERAIMAGDAETGVCIMDVEVTLDTGAVYAESRTEISPTDTTEILTHRLAQMGGALLCEVLSTLRVEPHAQIGEATYAHKITAEDQKIDWSLSAHVIDRQLRALRAFTVLEGHRVKILNAEILTEERDIAYVGADAVVGTGQGSLRLITVAPEGRPAMKATDWLRGRHASSDVVFEL